MDIDTVTAQDSDTSEQKKYIILRINDVNIMIPFEQVNKINQKVSTIAVPKARKFVNGAVIFNDRAIPVIDLKCLLNGNKTLEEKRDCVAVCSADNLCVGLIVNQIIGIEDINDSELTNPEKEIHGIPVNSTTGYYAKKDYLRVNLAQLLK